MRYKEVYCMHFVIIFFTYGTFLRIIRALDILEKKMKRLTELKITVD